MNEMRNARFTCLVGSRHLVFTNAFLSVLCAAVVQLICRVWH